MIRFAHWADHLAAYENGLKENKILEAGLYVAILSEKLILDSPSYLNNYKPRPIVWSKYFGEPNSSQCKAEVPEG